LCKYVRNTVSHLASPNDCNLLYFFHFTINK
jgi:hypothetical protein